MTLSERILVIFRATDQPVISIPLLRALLNRPKREFDAAIMELAQVVRLYEHDCPCSLNADQQYELVRSGPHFYCAISTKGE